MNWNSEKPHGKANWLLTLITIVIIYAPHMHVHVNSPQQPQHSCGEMWASDFETIVPVGCSDGGYDPHK